MSECDRYRMIVISANRLRNRAIMGIEITEPIPAVLSPKGRVSTPRARDLRLARQTPALSPAEQSAISAVYQECREKAAATGIDQCVDHVWPIAKGGAHHPDNLQILTRKENAEKGARHDGVSGVKYYIKSP